MYRREAVATKTAPFAKRLCSIYGPETHLRAVPCWEDDGCFSPSPWFDWQELVTGPSRWEGRDVALLQGSLPPLTGPSVTLHPCGLQHPPLFSPAQEASVVAATAAKKSQADTRERVSGQREVGVRATAQTDGRQGHGRCPARPPWGAAQLWGFPDLGLSLTSERPLQRRLREGGRADPAGLNGEGIGYHLGRVSPSCPLPGFAVSPPSNHRPSFHRIPGSRLAVSCIWVPTRESTYICKS